MWAQLVYVTSDPFMCKRILVCRYQLCLLIILDMSCQDSSNKHCVTFFFSQGMCVIQEIHLLTGRWISTEPTPALRQHSRNHDPTVPGTAEPGQYWIFLLTTWWFKADQKWLKKKIVKSEQRCRRVSCKLFPVYQSNHSDASSNTSLTAATMVLHYTLITLIYWTDKLS